MKVISIGRYSDAESDYFIRTIGRELRRRGNIVTQSLTRKSKVPELFRLINEVKKSDLMMIDFELFRSLSPFKRRILCRILKRREERGLLILTPETVEYSASDISLLKELQKKFCAIISFDDYKDFSAEYGLEVRRVGMPVDMAARDFRRPNFNRSGGRLVVLVYDQNTLATLRNLENKSPDMFRILKGTNNRERAEEQLIESHIIVLSANRKTLSSIGLCAMALGKMVITPENEKYRIWTAEEPAHFYPAKENPEYEDMIEGNPVMVSIQSGNNKEGDKTGDNGNSMVYEEAELERVLHLALSPELLKEIGEEGRNHVRRHHSAELVTDRILSGAGILPKT